MELARSLLDFNIWMCIVFDDNIFDSLNDCLRAIFGIGWVCLPDTDRELRQRSEAPHNDDVAPFAESLFIAKYFSVHIEYLLVVYHIWLSVWMLASAIY